MSWLRPAARRLAVPLVVAAFALFAGARTCTSVELQATTTSGTSTGAEPGLADDDPVRVKGFAPHLRLHRSGPTGVEELRDGDVARAGDLVQISYVAAGDRNGVVVSLDGRGQVTLHHPVRPDAAASLEAHGEHALDHAYELDDAQPYERFVLVSAGAEPVSAAVVLAAARDLAKRGPAARHSPLPVPARWRQSTILLQKRP